MKSGVGVGVLESVICEVGELEVFLPRDVPNWEGVVEGWWWWW